MMSPFLNAAKGAAERAGTDKGAALRAGAKLKCSMLLITDAWRMRWYPARLSQVAQK
jgi:hypothetical protein